MTQLYPCGRVKKGGAKPPATVLAAIGLLLLYFENAVELGGEFVF